MESLNLIDNNLKFKYLNFEEVNNEYIAVLTDSAGDAVVKGYGKTKIAALDDMHSCLI